MGAMNIQQNVSLREHSTMRLGGAAAYLADVSSRQDVVDGVAWAEAQGVPVMMVGDGSNIVWRDEGFAGLILVNKIKRFEMFDEDGQNVYVTVGAGENWDSAVARTVEAGLTGIECLSLVPGTAGATPVQNVGAYGQEISQTLVTVEAYDAQTKTWVNIPAMDCAFAYRTSRFKITDRGRFFITAVTLHLMKGNPVAPFYSSLEMYLENNHITQFTPQVIRDAIVAIRRGKLPDPAEVANNGSFFANPIVDEQTLTQMQFDYPDVPHWPVESGKVKLSAAWLIEQAGFKGVHDKETGMATWPLQPLVFVNEKAQSTADLLKFRQKVLDTVQQKFQITLTQEPELLP